MHQLTISNIQRNKMIMDYHWNAVYSYLNSSMTHFFKFLHKFTSFVGNPILGITRECRVLQ